MVFEICCTFRGSRGKEDERKESDTDGGGDGSRPRRPKRDFRFGLWRS